MNNSHVSSANRYIFISKQSEELDLGPRANPILPVVGVYRYHFKYLLISTFLALARVQGIGIDNDFPKGIAE